MARAVAYALLVVAGCGGGVQPDIADAAVDADPLAQSCGEAASHADLAWIQAKVLTPSCVFGACHNGGDPATTGRVDLRDGKAQVSLVGVTSHVDSTRKLVVAGYPAKSYLLVLIGQIAPQDADPAASPIPADVGTMPQGTAGRLLCVEKRQAIERWILNGGQP